MTAIADPRPAAELPGAPDHYMDADGARLRYRDQGQGPAVVFVHGWTLDLQMWEPQAQELGAEFRVVRLDRRGHGLSTGLPDTGRDAADIAALVHHLRLGPFALVGMSQGARAALALAAAGTVPVTALILDGPPALETPESDDVPVREFQTLARTQGMEAFRRAWAQLPFMQLHTGDVPARQLLAQMLERYPGHELLADLPVTPAPALQLESLAVPTLVVTGAYDTPARARTARSLCTRLPHARCAVIEAAGHLPNLDQPARYNQLCRAYLTRHAVGA